MALPFLNGATKRDQLISIDLGGRTTKAVHLQRKGDAFVLSRYALLDAPIYEKNLSADLLGEHLKNVCQALDARITPRIICNRIYPDMCLTASSFHHEDCPSTPTKPKPAA